MRPGIMDRRITFQQLSYTRDDSGEQIKTWSDLLTTWAMVKEGTGSEEDESKQISAMWDVTFKIRHRDNINHELRILYDGDLFDIEEIKELGRREGLEIKAKRIWQS